jgi:DNA-binding transcriptional regulator GbsR (MarR family)
MNKPLILELDEAKKELVQSVNEIMQRHGLNCYLLEPAFADLYAQIKATAQNELAQARQMEMAKATTQND